MRKQTTLLSNAFCFFGLALASPLLAQGPPAAIVKVEAATIKSIAPTVWLSGTVQSRNDALISAEVTGTVDFVVEVGDRVEANGPIAKLENNLRVSVVEENKARVLAEQSRIGFLEKDVARLRKLAEQNNAAKSRIDEVSSQLDTARANEQVAQQQLVAARIALAKSTIRAPFAGLITERFIDRGEYVNVGSNMVRLVDEQSLEVVSRVPLQSVINIKTGDLIALRNSQKEGEGKVRAVVPVGDPTSRLAEVRIAIDENKWIIGEDARLAAPTEASQTTLVVPRDAIVLRRDGASVYRINAENVSENISVTTGVSDGAYTAVTGELNEGDLVVVRGAERLRPGQTVTMGNDAP